MKQIDKMMLISSLLAVGASGLTLVSMMLDKKILDIKIAEKVSEALAKSL